MTTTRAPSSLLPLLLLMTFGTTAGAVPTIDDAAACVTALLRGNTPVADHGGVREASALELRDWLRTEIEKVRPSRRDRIIAALRATSVDDAQVPASGKAVYRSRQGRVFLRTRSIGKISTFGTVVHEFDHLFYDLDSALPYADVKHGLRIVDPRSIVRRVERRAHATEHDFTSAVFARGGGPEALYDLALREAGFGDAARALTLRLLNDSTLTPTGLGIVLDDEDRARLSAGDPVYREAIERLLDVFEHELSGVMRIARTGREAFVGESVRGYRVQVAQEYLAKLVAYGTVAGWAYLIYAP